MAGDLGWAGDGAWAGDGGVPAQGGCLVGGVGEELTGCLVEGYSRNQPLSGSCWHSMTGSSNRNAAYDASRSAGSPAASSTRVRARSMQFMVGDSFLSR